MTPPGADTLQWRDAMEHKPEKNELCLCWLDGVTLHSGAAWHRCGYALLVYHGPQEPGTNETGWRMLEIETAMQKLDMTDCDVTFWARLPKPLYPETTQDTGTQ